MREHDLLNLFLKNLVIDVKSISAFFKVSDRTSRIMIKSLRDMSSYNGFFVNSIRGKGYQLHIFDDVKFSNFLESAKKQSETFYPEILKASKRSNLFLYFLLQQSDYITIQQIADLLHVSRNTIVSDLDDVIKKLSIYNLTLDLKSHYGMKVNGDEIDFRRAFYRYVLQSEQYMGAATEYLTFSQTFSLHEISDVVSLTVFTHGLNISETSLNSIVDHIGILLFRLKHSNFIRTLEIAVEIQQVYIEIANEILTYLSNKYLIEHSELEVSFLAIQVAGKTSVSKVPSDERRKYLQKIDSILRQLDLEFQTTFSDDGGLEEALLLHMYPLMKRMSFQLKLTNPLVENVSSEYANVFLVALRFSELWLETTDELFSRDEIGYLALHFATHLERKNQRELSKIKRIILVSNNGRSSDSLLKVKVEKSFPIAKVILINTFEIHQLQNNDADIILTTVPVCLKLENQFIAEISVSLDEQELHRVKYEFLAFRQGYEGNESIQIRELFKKELIYFEGTSQVDYLDLLKVRGYDLVNKGYAVASYPESVIAREQKFTTVYKNGVAGPHSMELNAIENAISVTVLKNPIYYQNKPVNLVLMINIKSNYFFVHKEISHFILEIIKNNELLSSILKTNSYEEFITKIENII